MRGETLIPYFLVSILTNCTYAAMSESKITDCQQFIHVFQVSFLRLICLQY